MPTSDAGELERRVRKLELGAVNERTRLEAAERRLRDVRKLELDVAVLQRTDAVERAVEHALSNGEVRGWGRRQQVYAALAAGGLVVSLALQAAQLLGGGGAR